MAQEQATARIEVRMREVARRAAGGDRSFPSTEDLLHELLAVPEPQCLITEFLVAYAGGPGSEDAFRTLGTEMVRIATRRVFADLSTDEPAELEKLLLLGAGGLCGVALAGAASPGASRVRWTAPLVTDLDAGSVARVTSALDQAARRQLRLATVLHGQAEAIVRLRAWRDGRRGDEAGSRRARPPADLGQRAARLWVQALALLRPLASGEVRPSDLAELEVILDVVGDVIHAAAEQRAAGDPCRALYLLAGLRLPVPAGLPGRLFQQESMAQIRPLAALGTWHRLAVARWACSALAAIAGGDLELAGSSSRGDDDGLSTAAASGR